MSFLAPAWLLLAALAGVPLLLHLLRRRIGAKVDFPAVRYLERAQKEHSRRLKMRNLLLMVLRILIVILVAFAAARPLGRAPGRGHPPTAIAIVLDNSLSTSAIVDGRTVLERLRDAARAVVARATEADRLWLVAADGRVISGTRATIRDAIVRLEPLGGRGDLPAAVARASAALAASGMSSRRLAIATDGQATAWPTTIDAGGVSVWIYAPGVRPPSNHAVAAVNASPQRWTPSGAIALRVIGADSVVYRLALGPSAQNMRTLARGTARASEEVVAHASPPERGWLAGASELAPDELRGDDSRWFAVWVGAAPRASAHPSAGPFARSALEALVQSGRAAAGADVSITAADAALALPGILLAPSTAVRAGAANRELARLGVPWRFGALRDGETEVRGPRISGVTVTRRFVLTAQAGAVAETLAVSGGEPWIVAGDGYVLVGSPLAPEATNFPLRAAFVPWLADAIGQRLSSDAGGVQNATPGAMVRRPTRADGLEDPQGRVTALAGSMFPTPARAGTYFFRRGSARVGALVVNGEAEESVLRRLAPGDLTGRLRGSSVVVRDRDAESWSSEVFTGDARRPLEGALLLLALAALVAETLVTRRAERGSILGKAA